MWTIKIIIKIEIIIKIIILSKLLLIISRTLERDMLQEVLILISISFKLEYNYFDGSKKIIFRFVSN